MSEPTKHRVDEIQGEIVHVYDGIEEADNKLPNWWLWTFWGAIVFGILYWYGYEVFDWGLSPEERYAVAAAEMENSIMPPSVEELRKMSQSEQTVAEGREIFVANCVSCHMDRGQGAKNSVGPNLTDNFWIHGGKPGEIFNTISEGVQGTAMVSWRTPLGMQKVGKVAAYVMTLRGTDVEGGKKPEGEPFATERIAGEQEGVSATSGADDSPSTSIGGDETASEKPAAVDTEKQMPAKAAESTPPNSK